MKPTTSPRRLFRSAAMVLSLALAAATSGNAVTETFNTPGTVNWVCPPGVTTVQVECWGGGGAGGAGAKQTAGTNTSQNGGGGGGGAYARKNSVSVTPGQTYVITIPAAAVSGTNGLTNGGGRVNGGTVTFVGNTPGTDTVTAAGGTGGAVANSGTSNATNGQGGGAGGTTAASVGDVRFAGGSGSAGNTGPTSVPGSGGGGAGDANPGGAAVTNAAVSPNTTTPGAGGLVGGGAGGQGRGSGNGTSWVGLPGTTPGGGGAGAKNCGNSTTLGGNGGLGQIVLTYTIPPNYKADNTDNLNLLSSWTVFVPTGVVAEWNNTVTGPNTTSLGADITFSGIKISDPAGLVTVNSGNILTLGAAALDLDLTTATQDLVLNCDLNLGAANVWDVTSGRSVTLGGAVTGSGAITKQGAGTATLSGAATHTGATTVSGGTLTLASSGSITTASNILLTVSGASAVANLDGTYTSTGGGGIAINSGAVLNSSGTVSISGANNQAIFLGTAGGAGTWNVTGGSVNVNYTSNGWGISNGGNGTLNVSAGSVTTNPTNTFQVGFAAGGTGTLTISGTGLVTISAGSGGFNLGRVSGATGVINLDGGTLLMGRNFTTAAGATSTMNFNGGLLRAGLSSGSYMSGLTTANVRDGGAKIDTNGFNITIAQPLLHSTIGGDNATDGGLTKSGNGALTLAGANTYNGGTQVNGGALKFTTGVPSTTEITVASGAEAGAFVAVNDAQWVNTGNLTLQNNGAIVVDYGSTTPSTTVAPIQVTDFIIDTSAGVRLIANPATALVVGQTYPLISWTGTGPIDGTAFSCLTHRLAGNFSVSSNTLFFQVTSNTGGVPVSWDEGNGDWDTVTSNWVDSALNPTTYFDTLDSVLFGDAAGATGDPTVTLGAPVSPVSVTMDSDDHDYTISGAGSISGTGGLTLSSTNTRTLTLSTASNSFTGGTTINGGTLALGHATDTLLDSGAVTVDGGTAVLSLGANNDSVGAVSVKNGAAINGTGTLTGTSYALESGSIAANLAGGGALTKTTAGTVTLSGDNSATTGATTISGGTLVAANVNAFNTSASVALSSSSGSGTLHLATDTSVAAFPITSSSTNPGAITVDRATAGAGITHVLGSSILANNIWTIQAGANVTSGTAAVSLASVSMNGGNAGTCTINATTADVLIPGSVSIVANSFAKTLALTGSSTGNDISGAVSNGLNTVTVTKSGTGTWTLSGANTYTGATTVNSGTLTLSGSANITAAGAYTVGSTGNNATLNLSAGTYALGTQNYFVGSGTTSGFTGTVNHSGGTISFTGGNAVLIGNGTATGIYNLSGTAVLTTGAFSSSTRGVILGVNTGSSGTLNMSGGTLSLNSSSLQVGRSDSAADNTTTLFNQTAGTATVGTLRIGGNGATGVGLNATFNVTGGTFTATAFDRLALGNSNTATLTIGGTAQVTLPAFPTARGTGSSASITFDSTAGGYLRPAATSATYMPAGTFSSAGLTANGAIIDTNNFDITIGQVLEDAPSAAGTLTKEGTGTLTLTGANTYTGNTTVNAGSLVLADNAQLKFVLGATSGSNNSLTGGGTVTLEGDFVIDTSAADALASGSWTLENVPSLAGPYGSNFTVVGFTNAGGNKWTKTNGSKLYTFDETTGVLTLVVAASYATWIDGFFPGETNPAIIGAGADPDNDGVTNGAEMVIGGNPSTGMDVALLPTLELVTDPVSTPSIPAGNYLLFTYRRTALSEDAGLTPVCETDADLVAPWTTAVDGVGGVVVQEDTNFSFTPAAPANTDRVRVYVPRGANDSLFGRLNVLVPAP